jgi:lipopolysaccharide transport system ATP-binding protein
MTTPAIRVEGLGKRYQLEHGRERQPYRTLRDSIMNFVTAPLRKRGSIEEFWALSDVGFEVQPGEVVGIIGRNGAGKSTLLKILSRITKPTTGRVEINGRVGSLLEVGTGFHPELTGRENIYLNGSILGMSRAEITKKFDEIVAFAEVDKFLDTPVKRYSSGMYVRLAFAVAAHLEPEILVVDEVLAVGDAQFQKKCLGKMSEVAHGGRTVLFVSHNMAAVKSLCSRAVWIQRGKVVNDGAPSQVIDEYHRNAATIGTERTWAQDDPSVRHELLQLVATRVRPVGESSTETLSVHDAFDLEFDYLVREPDVLLNLSIYLTTQDEVCAFNVTSLHEPNWDGKRFPAGRFRTSARIPGDLLNAGRYTVSVLFVRDRSVPIIKINDVLSVDVNDSPADRGNWFGHWPGAVRPRLQWATERLTAGAASSPGEVAP